MSKGNQISHALALLSALLLGITLAACGGGAESALATDAATATPEAPAGVLAARDAVLSFMREGAMECVPPEQAGWTVSDVANPPAGYNVYRFQSGGCAMTITATEEVSDDMVYHVALGDGVTGFCWQAIANARGQVLLTGNAAQTDPTYGNPAQSYCEQNGHTFEVVTLDSGQLCGQCLFADGRACNAWAFFHGVCTPENAPTVEP